MIHGALAPEEELRRLYDRVKRLEERAVPASVLPALMPTLATLPAPASSSPGDTIVLRPLVGWPGWILRYDADGWWYCIGSSDWQSQVDIQEPRTVAGAWGNLATLGPAINVPEFGDYLAMANCRVDTTVAGATGYMSVNTTVTAPSSIFAATLDANGGAAVIHASRAFSNVAKGAGLWMTYYGTAAGGLYFAWRQIIVRPIRLKYT